MENQIHVLPVFVDYKIICGVGGVCRTRRDKDDYECDCNGDSVHDQHFTLTNSEVPPSMVIKRSSLTRPRKVPGLAERRNADTFSTVIALPEPIPHCGMALQVAHATAHACPNRLHRSSSRASGCDDCKWPRGPWCPPSKTTAAGQPVQW